MDPLFTFNSHPLRPPSPGTTNSQLECTPAFGGSTYRKGKVDIEGAKLANPSSSIRCRPLRSHSLRREKENRVDCEQRDSLDGELGQAAKKVEKKMVGEVDLLTFSFRYSHQLPSADPSRTIRGNSTLRTRKDKDMRVHPLGLAQQQCLEGEGSIRRRIQSVKMSPRIVVPLSDRKLPRVFKTRQQQCLPPIADPPRKYDSLQLRQVRSANRPRCGYLHLFQEQLYQLGAAMLEQQSLVPF